MKSSKYTQATSPTDFDLRDYANMPTILTDDIDFCGNRTTFVENSCAASKEYLLKSNFAQNKCEENSKQDIEMVCNCAHLKEAVYFPKTRCKDHYTSEQDILVANRSFGTLPRYENASQLSLDRKSLKCNRQRKHTYVCEQNQKILQRLERNHSIKRIQSPEIINIHRANSVLYDAYGPENCPMKLHGYDKGDDYGFAREHEFARNAERSLGTQKKRRPAGDGIDAEMDDPELIFELPGHAADRPCACENVPYGPGFTTCLLKEDRFPPAPDVTRRLGTATPLGKPDPTASPPYYRTSASSSSNSATSSRLDLTARHWWIIATVLLLAGTLGVGVPLALKIEAEATFEERLETATRLLSEVPLIDGHNDLPWNIRKFLHNRLRDFNFRDDLRNVTPWSTSVWSHTDLRRLELGRVAAQFWAAYVPCDSQYKDAVQLTLEQIDVIRRLTEIYSPPLTLCTSAKDIEEAHQQQKLCSLIGVEGGHSLAGSLAVLRTLYHVGVRYLTLTSTCNTPWADCSVSDEPGRKPEHDGLTNFGKSVVKEMNRLGMIVDLSHVSVGTMRDALEVSKAPVIFSHSSAHALCNSTRNVQDATLRKLALNKGVVMINFYSKFLTCKDAATVNDAVAHINHIRDIAGVDNVGLGAGYDGINYVPQGLEDVSTYPTLFAELIATGKWSESDLKKLAGLNFLRVLQDVEKVRDDFKNAKVLPFEDVLHLKPEQSNCTSQDSKIPK